jgi:hypothetical protein
MCAYLPYRVPTGKDRKGSRTVIVDRTAIVSKGREAGLPWLRPVGPLPVP